MSGLAGDEKARFATLPNRGQNKFTNASLLGTVGTYDPTKWLTVFTAGAYGSSLRSLRFISTDTVTVLMHIAIYNTITLDFEHFNTISVTLAAGTNGSTPPVNCLSSTNSQFLPSGTNGKYVEDLKPGDLIVCTPAAAITGAKFIQGIATGLDFKAP